MASVDFDHFFVFNPKNSKIKTCCGVYDVFISILNLQTRCFDSAASLVQCWLHICCSFSAIPSEDRVYNTTGYDCMCTLLWLFSPPWFAVNPTLNVSCIRPLVVPSDLSTSNNSLRVVDPGLMLVQCPSSICPRLIMLVHLQSIPVYQPF